MPREVFISAASIWEISIKAGLDKIEVDVDELIAEITAAGFRELPVTNTRAAAVRHLPNHHRDPFDRLLIAQAITVAAVATFSLKPCRHSAVSRT